MYPARVKRHDWLQLALASVASVAAYGLWASQPSAVHPDELVLALHEVTGNLGDWVRHLRTALR